MLSSTNGGSNLDLTGQGNGAVWAGSDNLSNIVFIENQEKFKTVLLQGFLQKRQSVQEVSKNDKLKHNFNITDCLQRRQKS